MVFDISFYFNLSLPVDAHLLDAQIIRTGRNFTRTASPGEADSSKLVLTKITKQGTTYIVSVHIAHYVGHGF
jgi:hypothetical protein